MMSALVQHYQQQTQLSDLPWVANLQQAALAALSQKGFPTRADEDWKYTALDSLWRHEFTLPADRTADESALAADVSGSLTIQFMNGQLFGLKAVQNRLQARGIQVMPLTQAMQTQPELLAAHWSAMQAQHGWQALNMAMLGAGLFIRVPAGVQFEQPIQIEHIQDQAEQAVYLRHVIVVESGSQLRLIERYRGADHCAYLTSTQTDVLLGQGAQLIHYKLQEEGRQAFHLGHIQVNQQANSHFASHSLSLGGQLVRSDLDIDLSQSHASCLMNGIYLTGQGQHIDHHTTVHHRVPHCRSDQNYKGILTGQSRAVFNGKVVVAQDAQHTAASQQNKNLLLGRQAEIDTKPQLEIFADDVQCSHGATVGQLDEEALFYLATRGIDKQAAMGYLLHAFIAENLALVADASLAEPVLEALNQLSGCHDEHSS